MTKFAANRPLTDAEEAAIQREIASDPDSPEMTDAQLAQPMTFAEALKRGPGRPKLDHPRQTISIRLSPDVIAHYRNRGRGWQKEVEAILRKAAGL